MQHLADLSNPIVDIDFGTSQAQRRLATHRHHMLALATMLTAIVDIAHLVGMTAAEHLVHETIIVAGIVARVDVFEPLPVLDKDLLEDVPVLRRLCHHQIAPREGIRRLGIKRFYHVSLSASTPLIGLHRGTLTHLSRPGDTGTSGQLENAFPYTPTVSLDVISLVASSCGYYRGQIEQRAAN